MCARYRVAGTNRRWPIGRAPVVVLCHEQCSPLVEGAYAISLDQAAGYRTTHERCHSPDAVAVSSEGAAPGQVVVRKVVEPDAFSVVAGCRLDNNVAGSVKEHEAPDAFGRRRHGPRLSSGKSDPRPVGSTLRKIRSASSWKGVQGFPRLPEPRTPPCVDCPACPPSLNPGSRASGVQPHRGFHMRPSPLGFGVPVTPVYPPPGPGLDRGSHSPRPRCRSQPRSARLAHCNKRASCRSRCFHRPGVAGLLAMSRVKSQIHLKESFYLLPFIQ